MAITANFKKGSSPASAPTYLRELVLRAGGKTLCVVASSNENWDDVLRALNPDAPEFEQAKQTALDRDKPAGPVALGAPPKQWAVVAVGETEDACYVKAGEVYGSLSLLAQVMGADRHNLDVTLSRARKNPKREKFATYKGVTFCPVADYVEACEALSIEPKLDEVYPVLVKLGLVENNQ